MGRAFKSATMSVLVKEICDATAIRTRAIQAREHSRHAMTRQVQGRIMIRRYELPRWRATPSASTRRATGYGAVGRDDQAK
jgi:hypothetical protein